VKRPAERISNPLPDLTSRHRVVHSHGEGWQGVWHIRAARAGRRRLDLHWRPA
jgi:hypothetical protein